MITLTYNAYINKLATKFHIANKGSFQYTPLLQEELLKYKGEASKQEVKAF
jgi:hypothetical protein